MGDSVNPFGFPRLRFGFSPAPRVIFRDFQKADFLGRAASSLCPLQRTPAPPFSTLSIFKVAFVLLSPPKSSDDGARYNARNQTWANLRAGKRDITISSAAEIWAASGLPKAERTESEARRKEPNLANLTNAFQCPFTMIILRPMTTRAWGLNSIQRLNQDRSRKICLILHRVLLSRLLLHIISRYYKCILTIPGEKKIQFFFFLIEALFENIFLNQSLRGVPLQFQYPK